MPALLTSSPLLALLVQGVFWSVLTIGLYAVVKRMYRRWRKWWLMPLALTPLLVGVVLLLLHGTYHDYLRSAGWLVALLGPATVAFAIPIYDQRALIRRQWPVLAIGMVAGSATALATGWLFATLLGLDGTLRLSLLPRSISTPFAMEVSGDIGGFPDLTAFFVVLTGVVGAIIGEVMLAWLPVRTALARGALFGVAAHGAGTAKAHELGREEGTIAGLVMVFAGLASVLLAPLVAYVLR